MTEPTAANPSLWLACYSREGMSSLDECALRMARAFFPGYRMGALVPIGSALVSGGLLGV